MLEFVQSYFAGFVSALVLFGAVYALVWWVGARWLQRRKVQTTRRAGWTQIREEIGHSAIAGLGSTAFTLMLFAMQDAGWFTLVADPGVRGWWYEALTVAVLIVAGDTWFYWLHRLFHHPRFYKYIHAIHHKSLDVNPFTSSSFHIVEAVGLTLFIVPVLLLMPVSAFALGIVQAFGMFNNIKSHLGYELYPRFFQRTPFNWLVTATNHSLHHTQYNGNFGLYFRFWDWLCGTELKGTDPLFEAIHARPSGAEVVDNRRYKPLTIHRLKRETKDTVSVFLRTDDPQFHNYRAGQHLTVRVRLRGRTHQRCFSLSSTPLVDDHLRITVRLNGPVSRWLIHDAQPGDAVEALYAEGDFALDQNAIRHVMIAGGSGITPLRSMIGRLLATHPGADVTLLYANRTRTGIALKSELDDLAARHSNFDYADFISAEGQRIGRADLAPHATREGTAFYICGPEGLKTAVATHLSGLGVPAAAINVEHYAQGYVPWFGLTRWRGTEPMPEAA